MNLFEKVREKTKEFFAEAKGSHDWEHTERVYSLCVRIGEKEGADMEVLSLAAILHDIGRPEQDRLKGTICHAERGAALAREILERYGVDKKKIDKVVHCIETHRFRNNKPPQTKEAEILFDADKLDSIGATGVGRAFLFVGEVGAKLHDKHIDIEKTKPYTKEDTAYREFVVKLSKIKDRMLTGEGKMIAEERHRFMVDFFNRLNKEIDGDL